MLLSNQTHGEIIQTAMRNGLSAQKAVEIADLCNAWSAKFQRCDDCAGGELCTGCKTSEPTWNHKGFHAVRLDDGFVRYTAKGDDDDDAGLSEEGLQVLDEFKTWLALQKQTATAVGDQIDELKLHTTRTTKKLEMATDLLEGKERQLASKDLQIGILSGRINSLETQLKIKSAARPVVVSHTQQQQQQPKPVRLAGIDPFNHDKWDIPRSPQSTDYLDEGKIKTPTRSDGPGEVTEIRFPGS